MGHREEVEEEEEEGGVVSVLPKVEGVAGG